MNLIVLFAVLAAAQTPPQPSQPTFGSRINALNPKISASLDMLHTAGPSRDTSGAKIREVELAFTADVDPYSRLELYLAKPDGEDLEVEEGFATANFLPWGFSGRGGKFFQTFGRLNYVHTHELTQVNAPLALSSFLGPEGLNSVGAEISRAYSPFGVFMETSYAFLDGLGEADEERTATADVLAADGVTVVTVPVHEPEGGEPKKFRDFAHVTKTRLFADLSDTTNVEVSGSGAIHQPQGQMHRSLLGAELTLRWKPVVEGMYKSFIWRSEMLWSRRRLPDEINNAGAQTASAAKTDRRGAYSYAEYQWDRRWRGGLRGDYVEDPNVRNTRSVTRALAPYVTFTLSEFNRFRLQWERRWMPTRRQDDRVMLQWTVVLGPHGAHAY
jgi:hypothetical protein